MTPQRLAWLSHCFTRCHREGRSIVFLLGHRIIGDRVSVDGVLYGPLANVLPPPGSPHGLDVAEIRVEALGAFLADTEVA